MDDYDDYDETEAYMASLQGPTFYGTHQGSQQYGTQQRLRGPAPRAFATTPPGMRRNQYNSGNRSERGRYWVDEQPVMRDFKWSTITTKIPEIPPITEKAHIKQICLTQFMQKLESTKGDWADKTEALANEFNMIPNLESQAQGIIEDIETMDSAVYRYNAGELLSSTYTTVPIGNGADFTNDERRDIHWYKFGMDVDPSLMTVGNTGIETNRFPSVKTFTVYIRASRDNNGLRPEITKNISGIIRSKWYKSTISRETIGHRQSRERTTRRQIQMNTRHN